MPKLPVVKPRKLVRILKKKGFVKVRQTGSHLHLIQIRPGKKNLRATVPMHNKDIKRKTLKSILKQSKIKL